jgi:hypothetical protein
MAEHNNLVEVEALEAFTVTRSFGQFHGDPNGLKGPGCRVPADALDDLLRRGKVRLPDYIPQLDGDEDGETGGSTGEDSLISDGEFAVLEKGGGFYEISGPGLDEPEKVRGKPALAERLGELKAALAERLAQVMGDDGQPLDPPAGDLEADIANPAGLDEAPTSE